MGFFKCFDGTGLTPYDVGNREAPTLDQIPRFEIKPLKELYFPVKQKAKGKIKMIPAEKMNLLYGILTTEEAEEKWDLKPGTISRRCEPTGTTRFAKAKTPAHSLRHNTPSLWKPRPQPENQNMERTKETGRQRIAFFFSTLTNGFFIHL